MSHLDDIDFSKIIKEETLEDLLDENGNPPKEIAVIIAPYQHRWMKVENEDIACVLAGTSKGIMRRYVLKEETDVD